MKNKKNTVSRFSCETHKLEDLVVSFPPTREIYRVLPWLSGLVVKSQNTMKFASDITGVPLGRTEVLVVPNDAPSRELSHGQVLGGAPFDGGFKS